MLLKKILLLIIIGSGIAHTGLAQSVKSDSVLFDRFKANQIPQKVLENSTANTPSISQKQLSTDPTNWSADFGLPLHKSVRALAVHPQTNEIYIAGDLVDVRFNNDLNYILRFDGAHWVPFGDPVNGVINAMEFADDGTLFIGGDFLTTGKNQIQYFAFWNNTFWEQPSILINDRVNVITRDDEGNLYIGGRFHRSGNAGFDKLFKYSHSTRIAEDFDAEINGEILTVSLIQDIKNPGITTVAIGGVFNRIRTQRVDQSGTPTFTLQVEANNIAILTDTTDIANSPGRTFIEFGGLEGGPVRAIANYKNKIYAAGGFSKTKNAPIPNVVQWNGSRWIAAGVESLPGEVAALASDNNYLYAGGTFSDDIFSNLAKWDEAAWTPVENGTDDLVRVIESVEPSGILYGGDFSRTGEVATQKIGIVNPDGKISSIGNSVNHGIIGIPRTITSFEEKILVGGQFQSAGGLLVNSVAEWTNGWSRTKDDARFDNISKLFHTETDLYMLGEPLPEILNNSKGIYKWNSDNWDQVTFNGEVSAFVELDDALVTDKGSIYLAGVSTGFGSNSDEVSFPLAFYDSNQWSFFKQLQSAAGVENPQLTSIFSVVSHNNDIYVGGYIPTVDGRQANHILKWNGTAFETLDTGIENDPAHRAFISDMTISGDRLYVAGSFNRAGGVPAYSVAWWDLNDNTWNTLPSGVEDPHEEITSILVEDGLVFVGGTFSKIGDIETNGIAVWNGAEWSDLGGGLGENNVVLDMAFDENRNIYLVGGISEAGGQPSFGIAMYKRDGSIVPADEELVNRSNKSKKITFDLYQNYPNPFNPSTIIRYELKEPATVILRVFDNNGRLIEEMVNAEQPTGIYRVPFDASNLASGIYFYRLSVSGNIHTRKMLLLK